MFAQHTKTHRHIHSSLRPLLYISIALATFFSALPRYAQAQLKNAQISGIVTQQITGKPLASVTVVVTGPALQGFQSEVTDAVGRYLITELPPGDDYQVSFYYGISETPRFVQKGIRLSQDQTIKVNAILDDESGAKEVKIIKESAPNVDIASSSIGVNVNQEILNNTPLRGRTFESALEVAPGVANVAPRALNGGGIAGGEVGVSIGGGTGNENNFIIDGVNTTDPNLGLVGTELSPYLIKEITIMTGGYQAEYGRATGGVVSIVTKSGSNQFHGGLYGTWQPFQLEQRGVARLGEALATRVRGNAGSFDLGFDLGGPILRDHIWFYLGFVHTSTLINIQRRGRMQIADGFGQPIRSGSDFNCPGYLADSMLCEGPRRLAAVTQDFDYSQNPQLVKRLYNGIGKLQFSINPNHNITLTYLASPSQFNSFLDYRYNDLESSKLSVNRQVHDVSVHYTGKLLNKKLQLDALYGYHYQYEEIAPEYPSQAQIVYSALAANPFSLADFEDISACRRRSITPANGGPAVLFNPCPITQYSRGVGDYNQLTLQRHQAIASATYFLSFLGIHAIKLGGEFEDVRNDRIDYFTGSDLVAGDPASGHRIYRTDPSGQALQLFREYATAGPNGTIVPLNSGPAGVETRNFSVYLRDSWNVGFIPGLVLNLGIRWDGQELYAQQGKLLTSIYDNWAPRIGAVYDFTQHTKQPGRGKVFFNYGRFYESLPLDINRQASAVGRQVSGFSTTCDSEPLQPEGRSLPKPSSGCQFGTILFGGVVVPFSPGIKGQYNDEIVAGISFNVAYDIVLGLSYTHRELGNVINGTSILGGSVLLVANPGRTPDPDRVKELEADIEKLRAAAMSPNATAADQLALRNATNLLTAYRTAGTLLPTPKRSYDAFMLTLNKRFSNRFSAIASYSYSRLLGNFTGGFNSQTGQLSPNTDFQFLFHDVVPNRFGPLPNDRPHNFKLTSFYEQPLKRFGKLTAGLTFTLYSGRPIEVLGGHPILGLREVFLLPRGSGGRTPTVTQFDLHLGYEYPITPKVNLSVLMDVVNLFNQREITNVDDEYTSEPTNPILHGKVEDLRHLRTLDGRAPGLNVNYGQPTSFQEPLYMRIGGRLTF